MKIRKSILLAFVCLYSLSVSAQKKSKKDEVVTIETDLGSMKLILFDETPKHKANFLKLSNEKFYDGLLFHRVIDAFMIQGGDPDSRNAKPDEMLGKGDNGYKIPAEFSPKLFHQKGALAAARDNNPAKESSGCQFYIVQGRKWSKNDLDKQAARAARKLTDEQRKVYETIGGTPHLDGAYTVFGQVIDGMEVVDKIGAVSKDERDRPEKNIAMKVSVKKMKKKKITRKYGWNYEA
ncbi:peptidylprolyl isomerase [Dyadobacter sediminis]|uniref:Peptidyl-prolyl cis-trans isomerase n=1 Tax=Dyadobacter sediminis TaxID=1493691 RepID=A0A5R9KDA3_9BACT|nr:peptidylprolyl isomerase [Dyadobacter sediminis]TLU94114.1 peptidylprolyl isomerase [Dyadobacter sediminis]GGB94120.1 peptidyl-prolyl cis-trans isomerase [Dyadobacter sediminis]